LLLVGAIRPANAPPAVFCGMIERMKKSRLAPLIAAHNFAAHRQASFSDICFLDKPEGAILAPTKCVGSSPDVSKFVTGSQELKIQKKYIWKSFTDSKTQELPKTLIKTQSYLSKLLAQTANEKRPNLKWGDPRRNSHNMGRNLAEQNSAQLQKQVDWEVQCGANSRISGPGPLATRIWARLLFAGHKSWVIRANEILELNRMPGRNERDAQQMSPAKRISGVSKEKCIAQNLNSSQWRRAASYDNNAHCVDFEQTNRSRGHRAFYPKTQKAKQGADKHSSWKPPQSSFNRGLHAIISGLKTPCNRPLIFGAIKSRA
jgi:hypothetical protein